MHIFFGTLTHPEIMPTRRAAFRLTVFALILAAGNTLSAQSPPPATIGERVRITTPSQRGSDRIVGSVVAVQGDTLLLRASGTVTPRPVAIAEIRDLEVSFGRTGNARRGLLYGGVIGAVAGGVLGAVTYQKPKCDSSAWICDELAPSRSANAAAGGILGALAGLAVGGIWGATHPTERWIRRPLGGAPRVGIAPSGHGAVVSLACRF